MTQRAKIRLFVDASLGKGQSVILNRDQANYLFNVMRLNIGDEVALFNGQDGEWTAEVLEANKRKGLLGCQRQVADQRYPPDLWLVFAPIKKARTDFIVEKAVEMGVARILPVSTEFTNSDRIRQEKLQAHAIEAAEQCGGTYVPPVEEIQKFTRVLDDWPVDRNILFCDETLVGQPTQDISNLDGKKWAILIGPEGGFSKDETNRIRSIDKSHPISLGPRILRADTAAVAALALWQSAQGDWR